MSDSETSNLEDNLPMVNYIMLHRVYDMLTIIANMLAKDEDSRQQISKMIEYHEQGFLLGPTPAFRAEDKNE